MSAARKAKDAPHCCPVCGRLYVPSEESIGIGERMPSGTLVELQIGDDVCIKSTGTFFRVYSHIEGSA